MFELLKSNGFTAVDYTDWETEGVERVMIGNGKCDPFPMRIKKFYHMSEVVKRCEMLGIGYEDIPEEIRNEFLSAFAKFTAFCNI
jgi:hypothetical protein